MTCFHGKQECVGTSCLLPLLANLPDCPGWLIRGSLGLQPRACPGAEQRRVDLPRLVLGMVEETHLR